MPPESVDFESDDSDDDTDLEYPGGDDVAGFVLNPVILPLPRPA